MMDYKEFMYSYSLDFFAEAIEENQDKVQFFRIGDTDYVIEVDKEDMADSLTKMMDFYVSKELYEQAQYCKELLDKHQINMLIDSI